MPHSRSSCGSRSLREKEDCSNYYGKKPLICYHSGELRNIKKYCGAKESNFAQKFAEEEYGEKCIVAEARAIDVMVSINLEE